MKALDRQVGGDHYKHFAIQPIVFCQANGLGAIESNIIKYACRYKVIKRHGQDSVNVEDLRKIIHYAEMLIELELQEEQAIDADDDTFREEHRFATFESDQVDDPKLSAQLRKANCEDGTCDL